MKFIVPDIIVPATGEKTLRQYKCASISSDNLNADLTIAVTNKRIIQHAENNSSAKAQMLHNEIFIDNIGGVSFKRGAKRKKVKTLLLVLFFVFVAIGGLLFWQAEPVFDFFKLSNLLIEKKVLSKLCLAAIPLVVYLIIMLIILLTSKKYSFNMIIYTKGLNKENLIIESEDTVSSDVIIIPYLKETKSMIAEISSVILDIQKFGADEVLNHIDAEENL